MNKPIFDIDDYKGKYVMHCPTQEKAKTFCNYLYRVGKTWHDGTKYNSTYWETYEQNTIYYFNEGTFGTLCLDEKSYTVLEFDNFDWDIEDELISEKNLRALKDNSKPDFHINQNVWCIRRSVVLGNKIVQAQITEIQYVFVLSNDGIYNQSYHDKYTVRTLDNQEFDTTLFSMFETYEQAKQNI